MKKSEKYCAQCRSCERKEIARYGIKGTVNGRSYCAYVCAEHFNILAFDWEVKIINYLWPSDKAASYWEEYKRLQNIGMTAQALKYHEKWLFIVDKYGLPGCSK